MKIQTHEDLLAWQKAFKVAKDIYKLTEKFPPSEQYGLVSQMRRAAVSVPSNISEGYHRGSRKEYKQFCYIAYGSANELHTQLKLALALNYASEAETTAIMRELESSLKLLNRLCHAL